MVVQHQYRHQRDDDENKTHHRQQQENMHYHRHTADHHPYHSENDADHHRHHHPTVVVEKSPFRVLGIALVVDQIGKGPRMVLRYPIAPPPSSPGAALRHGQKLSTTQDSVVPSSGNNNNNNTDPRTLSSAAGASTTTATSNNNNKSYAAEEDLFFTLSPRQVAKLFRLKPALCGQPMTLSVGGTVFCCRAVLMDDTSDSNVPTDMGSIDSSSAVTNQQQAPAQSSSQQHSEQTTSSSSKSSNSLALFSVIVALAPQITSSLHSGISGWTEGDEDGHHHHHRHSMESLLMMEGKFGTPSSMHGKASLSFLCIRRVHVTLARLTRVLEREERRCKYISIQAERFDLIRDEIMKKGRHVHPYTGRSNNNNSSTGSTNTSDGGDNTSFNNSISMSGGHYHSSTHNTATAILSNSVHSPKSISSDKGMTTAPILASSSSAVVTTTTTPGVGPASDRSHRRSNSMTFTFRQTGSSNNDTRTVTVGGGGGDTNFNNISTNNTSKGPAPPDGSSIQTMLPFSPEEEKQKLLEQEQEIIETIMAVSPDSMFDDGVLMFEHQGNLARELVQVHHALARNDYLYHQQTSPSILLPGRDSLVYINRHIAVPIEAVAQNKYHPYSSSMTLSEHEKPRPYHTLLFPNVSPNQLLDSMACSIFRSVGGASATTTTSAPHRLQQILRMVHPQKSLSEAAVDANLPVQTVIDYASYLVQQGICIPAPVLSRKVRLACPRIETIQEMSLAFSQQFGTSINLFLLVSFLTSNNQTLGAAISSMTTSNEPDTVWLRKAIDASLQPSSFQDMVNGVGLMTSSIRDRTYTDPGEGSAPEIMQSASNNERDEFLFQMVAWLCSHKVLVQLQEYMVGKLPNNNNNKSSNSRAMNKSMTPSLNNDPLLQQINESRMSGKQTANCNSNKNYDYFNRSKQTSGIEADDQLLIELLEEDCLSGTVSIQACCWRIGIDPVKLNSFIYRCPYTRLIRRVPEKGDDWGAVV